MVYVHAGAFREVSAMWEAAASLSKKKEIYQELFSCYLREHDFSKQQALGMKMYTTLKDTKYLLWSCVALVFLQETGEGAKSSLVRLNTLMMERAFKESLSLAPEVCVCVCVV
jgi:hypothetical protein